MYFNKPGKNWEEIEVEEDKEKGKECMKNVNVAEQRNYGKNEWEGTRWV